MLPLLFEIINQTPDIDKFLAMDDDQLMALFRNGEEDAFKAVFDLFNKRLLFMAGGMLDDVQEAEDMVQDAFIRLWDRREHFSDLTAVKAFLYICVKNNCRNQFKRAKVAEKYISRQDEAVDDQTIVLKMIEAEVLDELYQAIAKLPAGCRDVIYLGYFEGLSNQEVADKLQVSINTVKTQKLRALKYLRILLKDFSPGLIVLLTKFL